MSGYTHLVLTDTNNVFDYLFSTTKYKFIRGASTLIDDMNRRQTIETATTFGGTIMSVGGGESKVLFLNYESAEKYIKELRRKYIEATDEVSITAIIVNREKSDGSIKEWLERGEVELRFHEINKDKKDMPFMPLYPVVERCQLCKKRPASEIYTLPEGDETVCYSCLLKAKKLDGLKNLLRKSDHTRQLDELEGAGLMEIHQGLIKAKGDNNTWVGSLSRLFDSEEFEDKYIGFVYADGRNIGNYFRRVILAQSNITDEKNVVEEYRNKSEGLHRSTINAAVMTAEEYKDCLVDYAIAGGDDFVAILPGKYAVPYTNSFLKHFEDEVSKNLDYRLSMTAGVVVAHVGFPLYRLFKMSYDLMSDAKSKGDSDSILDFAVITSSVMDISAQRKQECYGLSRKRTRMGGFLAGKGKEHIWKMTEVISSLREASFPRSKIKEVYEIVREENNQTMIYRWLVWRSRIDDRFKQVLDQWYPELKSTPYPYVDSNGIQYTPLLDLFDLYDII